MAMTLTSRLGQDVRHLTVAELAEDIAFHAQEIAAGHDRGGRLAANLTIYHAELARRERGGQIAAGPARQLSTDGERLIAGLEPSSRD